MTSKTKNSTGLTGVTMRNGKYEAGITVNGRSMYLGRYSTAEEAHQEYVNAKEGFKVSSDIVSAVEVKQTMSKKQEAKEYTRKMLESIDLKRVPERLKPLYAQYKADLAAGEYSAMRVVIGGNRAV